MEINELADLLKDSSQKTENLFLSLADRFQLLLGGTKETSLESLFSVFNNIEKTNNKSLENEKILFSDFDKKYTVLYEELNKKIKELSDLDTQVKIIKNDSEEMELITLNAMVISIKSGEKGLAFSCITENLKRLSNQMLQYTDQLLLSESEILQNISTLEQVVQAVINSQKSLSFLGTQSTDSIQKIIDDSTLSLKEMTDMVQTIYKPIQGAMEGLQLQDIIRQAIDHVLLSLQEFCGWNNPEDDISSRLDDICFDIELIQIAQDVLSDVISRLSELSGIFNKNWDELTTKLTEIETARKVFLQKFLEDYSADSENILVAIQNIREQFSHLLEEFTKFQGTQKNLEFSCQNITQWCANMNRTFGDLSPIIQNLHHVRILQEIEVAKNDAISSVKDSVVDMDHHIQSSNAALDDMQNLLESFSRQINEMLFKFTQQIETDNLSMKELKADKTQFFNELGFGHDRINEIMNSFNVLPEGFERGCAEVRFDLRKVNQIESTLLNINSELKMHLQMLEERKRSLLEKMKLTSWEIRDNRLKDLITHFTITSHKEAAGKVGGFGIEKQSAESGEITFF